MYINFHSITSIYNTLQLLFNRVGCEQTLYIENDLWHPFYGKYPCLTLNTSNTSKLLINSVPLPEMWVKMADFTCYADSGIY